VSKLNLSPLW